MSEEKSNNNRYIAKYISQLYRKSRIFINREVSKYDINSGQFMYLMDLYIQGGKNQEELSERLKVDKGTTARVIKKLEEKDLVTRVKDSSDKRCNRIYLTEKSREVEVNILNAFDEWNKMISENLTVEEEETLRNLLEKVGKNINI